MVPKDISVELFFFRRSRMKKIAFFFCYFSWRLSRFFCGSEAKRKVGLCGQILQGEVAFGGKFMNNAGWGLIRPGMRHLKKAFYVVKQLPLLYKKIADEKRRYS
jgi:hypothetical protein